MVILRCHETAIYLRYDLVMTQEQKDTLSTPSFLDDPFSFVLNWLVDHANKKAQEREEYVGGEAEALPNVQKYLEQHPELAQKALSAADAGLTSGVISPATYQMLKNVETTYNTAPNLDPVAAAMQSSNQWER